MRALVIYESMFGNTRDVALAVADGIGSGMPVETIEVSAAPSMLPADVTLLVVGGPTHAHGMTTAESRADAGGRAGERLVSRGIGVREWLGVLRTAGSPVAAAAFDTRIKGPGVLWGSAARKAEKDLRRLGFRVVVQAESFLVDGPTGPLFDRLVAGELERARAWGRGLATEVVEPASAR